MKQNNRHNEPEENYSMDLLNKIPKRNNFQVPTGYFDSLQANITENTTADNVINLAKNRFKWLRIITATAAVFTIGLFVYKSNQATEDCITFACLYETIELSDSELQALEDDSDIELFDLDEDELF